MSSSSVLLVNPNRMLPPIAPLGLEYCGEALQRAGFDVHWCDLTFESDWADALRRVLSAVRPVAVAVSLRNLDDAYFASQDFILGRTVEILNFIQEHTTAPMILGGVGFSIAPAEVLQFTGADYGIAGDGEESLPELIRRIRDGQSLDGVPGAVFRLADGAVQVNGVACCDISAWPAPLRRLPDHRRYFAEGGQAGIETKRGCGQRCVYCVEPHAKGRPVRLRAPESVGQEMRHLLDQGVNVFHLCDSEFNQPPEHAHAVCAAIMQQGLAPHVRWYAYASPAPFDAALAHAMEKAGCAGVNFGVDHGDPGMLHRLGRPYGPDAIRRTAAAVRETGMALMFDLLLGSPGETRESLATAIGLMREVAPDRVGLSCGVRVYPHTLLGEAVRHHGPLKENPNLHGVVENNDDLLRPIFFVESALNGDIHRLVSNLVDGDSRFLHTDPSQLEGNYNYNDNSVLATAIRNGARGAYWDILRRLEL